MPGGGGCGYGAVRCCGGGCLVLLVLMSMLAGFAFFWCRLWLRVPPCFAVVMGLQDKGCLFAVVLLNRTFQNLLVRLFFAYGLCGQGACLALLTLCCWCCCSCFPLWSISYHPRYDTPRYHRPGWFPGLYLPR